MYWTDGLSWHQFVMAASVTNGKAQHILAYCMIWSALEVSSRHNFLSINWNLHWDSLCLLNWEEIMFCFQLLLPFMYCTHRKTVLPQHSVFFILAGLARAKSIPSQTYSSEVVTLVPSSWCFAWSYRLFFWSRYLVLAYVKSSGVFWEKPSLSELNELNQVTVVTVVSRGINTCE